MNSKVLPNLNFKSFWNDLNEKYPVGVADFASWIDNYKKEHHWDDMFPPIIRQHYSVHIKFHDLPVGFQIGILQQYLSEKNLSKDTNADLLEFVTTVKKQFTSVLIETQNELKTDQWACCDSCDNKAKCQSFGCEIKLGFKHKNAHL